MARAPTNLPIITASHGVPTYDIDTVTARALANAVSGEVRLGAHDRRLYATDASIYEVEPLGVVLPDSLDDAERAVRFCAEHNLPILPRGGGTSLAGQCVNNAVVIDLTPSCFAIGRVTTQATRVRAEAGATIAAVNHAAAPRGLHFAPDPSTIKQATVGGCIGNNAAGVHSVLYGRTSENIAGIEACLADGRRVYFAANAGAADPIARDLAAKVIDITRRHAGLIRERFPKTKRRSAGYQLDVILDQLDAGATPDTLDLAPLLCGSEGTLAVTLAADLVLQPLPASKGLAVLAFATLEDAIAAVGPCLELNPSAVELLDDLIMDLARGNAQQRRNVDVLPHPDGKPVAAVLYVEFFSSDPHDDFAERFDALRRAIPTASIETHTDPTSAEKAWALRRAGEPLLHAIPGERKPLGFIEDNAVPPEHLGAFVAGVRGILTTNDTRGSFYAHASVGVLHIRPLLSLRDPTDVERMHRIAGEVAALAKSLGGVMSGEHGDGRARGPLLDDYFGPELINAFREVKAVFDPRGLLNPGNIVDPAPLETISQHTRVRPDSTPLEIAPVDTFYTYTDQTDFAHAVEMCNGAGVCRKTNDGVMCPSYMATRDERHSTRGRGNALRSAISGRNTDGAPAWNDPETLATLDLCLSCKACKSECPSSVDVARLKAEYVAQGRRENGHTPLRAHIFGHIHTLNTIAGRTPRLANSAGNLPPSRWFIEKLLGIDRRRSLPKFKTPLHRQWGRDRDPAGIDTPAPRVVLLADTFTTHNEPEIALATRRVLEAFGYRVELFRGTDFGRAMISMGLLDDAITDADRVLDRLAPLIADDTIEAFVCCEPSCISSITDDWRLLKLATPAATRDTLAAKTMLPEDFIARRWDDHPRRPHFAKPAGRVVLHAHCHQKALDGAHTSADALRLAFGGAVESLDTTCCGLAGSFGYTTGRFDLSMQVGELGVLPAARAIGTDDVFVATGTSCRHQVKDGAQREAVHPIALLDQLIVREGLSPTPDAH